MSVPRQRNRQLGLVEGPEAINVLCWLKMDREAVQALVAKMKGETVHAVADSGSAVVTEENLGTPEIQALLVQSKDIQWSWVSTTVALKELDSGSNL